MSGNIYTLYKSHCENVGKYRGIEISGSEVVNKNWPPS